jgi:ribosomal protein L7/L12
MSVESENIELLRARILELEARLDYLYKHFGLVYSAEAQASFSEADAKIIQLARQNKMIEAIKLHRETYHTGLSEAKDAVESLVRGS